MASTSESVPTQHIASKIKFEEFCQLCESIKSSKQPKIKAGKLQKYMESFRTLCDNEDENLKKDMFPILRLLLPNEEKERTAYGIKEQTLAKMFIRILNLSKDSHEAAKLLKYKSPTSSQAACSDFADVAFYILKSRNVASGSLTIQDVNEGLDKMALFHSENKPREVDNELTKFITKMTAFQQKWLVRIILKEMKLGIEQQKILSLFHPDAPDLFDSCNNLAKVCATLHSLDVKLNEIEVETFSAFRPMLSDKLDIKKINSVLKGDNEIFIETKFDGERFQIHMKDKKFKYFSRNGFDFTENYGATYESPGLLTKYLKDSLDQSVHSFILDGEMMGWHKNKKVFGSKGMTFDVKKMNENSSYRPCFCAFDILQYNGKVITNLPLKERLTCLDRLFEDKEGVIQHSKRVCSSSSEDVLSALNKAIDDQEEGIVIKFPNSLYRPNSRKSGWFKIKPEYTDEAMNELDLLIIGGYYSENKRHGLVNSVMLGLAVPPEVDGDNPSVFHSVGRVKLSLRAEDLEELCRKLHPHWIQVDKSTNLSSLCWTKDKPDVYIKPENSYVLQIKASELVRSNAFKTEYTLRFPRIEKIRYDKPWYGCMTTTEYAELTKNSSNVEKLTARRIKGEELEVGDSSTSPRKRQKTGDVAPQFQRPNLEGVEEVSTLFFGKEICVITGNEEFSKADLEIKISENGGKIVQNPGLSTFCVIAGVKNARVTNIIKTRAHNVATVDWLLRSLDTDCGMDGEIPKWTPKDLLGTTDKMAGEFELYYDEFGDSFTEPATKESLKFCFDNVAKLVENVHLLPVEMEYLDKELFPDGHNPFSFMRMCVIHIVEDYSNLTDKERKMAEIELQMLKLEYEFFAGKCSNNLLTNGLITHVLIPSFISNHRLQSVMQSVELIIDKPIVASVEWLKKCLKERRKVQEDDYIVIC